MAHTIENHTPQRASVSNHPLPSRATPLSHPTFPPLHRRYTHPSQPAPSNRHPSNRHPLQRPPDKRGMNARTHAYSRRHSDLGRASLPARPPVTGRVYSTPRLRVRHVPSLPSPLLVLLAPSRHRSAPHASRRRRDGEWCGAVPSLTVAMGTYRRGLLCRCTTYIINCKLKNFLYYSTTTYSTSPT